MKGKERSEKTCSWRQRGVMIVIGALPDMRLVYVRSWRRASDVKTFGKLHNFDFSLQNQKDGSSHSYRA